MSDPSRSTPRKDPYRNFRFRLTLEGRTVAAFSHASSLAPGARAGKSEAVTLERGVSHDRAFAAWVAGSGRGDDGKAPAVRQRRNLVLEVLDESGGVARKQSLRGAWIAAFQALPELDANANAVAIAHLRVEHGVARITAAKARSRATTGLAALLRNSAEPTVAGQAQVNALVAEWKASAHGAKTVSTPRAALLFTGPGVEDKRAAASIIAGQLGLGLHRVDLAAVVSQYLGETEKNLDRAFAAAARANALLFFDEADALFSKRTEVKDSHDKYANQEISYLLERISSHPGLIVVATNGPARIDPAWLRRFKAVAAFPKVSPRVRATASTPTKLIVSGSAPAAAVPTILRRRPSPPGR